MTALRNTRLRRAGASPRNLTERKKKIKKVDKADALLGGAIETKKVRFQDVESRKPDVYDRAMRHASYISGGPVLEGFMHGVVDFRPRNVIGYDQYAHFYEKHPEEYLHQSAMQLVSGSGAQKDHPRIQRLFHESFKQMPEIMNLYTQA